MLISYKKPRGRFFVVGGKAQPVVEWTVIISSGANGSVSVDGVTGNYSATVPDGTVLEIEATASEHYSFSQWSDGSTSATRTVTVTGDLNLTASFAIDTYMVNIIAGDNGSVSVNGVSGNYSQYVAYGTQLEVAATPATGYGFDSWSDGDSTNPRTLTVTGSISLAASFQEETQYYSVNIYSTGEYTVIVDGVEGDYSESVAEGTELSVEAIVEEGYIFDQWSDGESDNPRSLTVDGQIELVAYCHPDVEPTYLTVNGVQNEGTVSIDGGEPDYSVTEQVVPDDCRLIEAFPEEGYEFVEWTTQGQVSVNDPTENPTYACAGSEDAATNIVNAVFQQVEQDFNVDIHAGANGSVSVDGDEGDYLNTVPGGTVLEIEAVPDTGYEFDSWSDGDTSNPRTLIVDDDISLAASFKEGQPNNEIWYTSTDSNTIIPNMNGIKGRGGASVTLVSNTYTNGKGVIKFSADVVQLTSSGYSSAAFYNRTTLASVSLPDSITTITTSAFNTCRSLASVKMPASLVAIGIGSFGNCRSLTAVSIPASVTSIGTAFQQCSSLTSITFESTTTVPTVNSQAFTQISSTGTVYGQPGLDYSAVMAALPSGWTLVQ